LGVAALALFLGDAGSRMLRLIGLACLGAATFASVLLLAPNCLTGPYGSLPPEVKTLWLDSVLEAQPLFVYAARDPVGAIATVGPPLVALVIALRGAWSSGTRAWMLTAALLALALALSLYQVRTIPHANAVAIPVFAAWLTGIAARRGIVSFVQSLKSLPMVGAFLLAMPLVYLAAGWAAVEAVSALSGGRIAPPERTDAPAELVAGLTVAERNCLDDSAASAFAHVEPGLVLAPVFYGPAVLMLSPHEVVAGPYHRNGDAILDSIHAMRGSPEEARRIVEARNVDYVAICTTTREAALNAERAPDGLLALLMANHPPAWLEPVQADKNARLHIWRVSELRGARP
jgi:hypothetical protein